MPAILQRTVCVMSTDKENNQIEDMKVEEKEKEEVKKVEANDVEKKEPKDVKEDEAGGDSEPEKEKVVQKKSPTKPKEAKKKKEEVKSEEEEEHEESEEEEKDEEDEEEVAEKPKKEKGVPLLDQPLSVTGPRQRKGVERLSVAGGEHKDPGPIEIPEGRGVSLGSISVVEYNISRIKGDDLKKLHQLLFGRTAKPTFVKKNIRKFNGFDFEADSDQHEKKKGAFLKLESSALKDIAGVLNLTKGGPKEDVAARILDFLMEPAAPAAKKGAAATGSTAAVLTKGGRPKRSAAAKANNKGYSESEDEDDHKRGPRSRRAKGKRVNLKDESSSEDEREKKRDSEEEEKASEASVEEPPSSDESEDGGSKKKRTPAKVVPAKKATPAKKAAPAKKAEKKAAPTKRKAKSEEEEEEDESSSDDVPLSKKIKAPPTDEEIKTYVKQILEGANLEEITMKTVCKQVYSHYPDFDLAHKKDFIKTTVKSLIST